MRKDPIHQLIRNLAWALKLYSVDEVNQILETKLNNKESAELALIDYAILRVAQLYETTKKKIIISQQRGEIKVARSICICLLNKVVGLDQKFIAKDIFERNPGVVHRVIKDFEIIKLEKTRSHKEFMEKYNIVATEIQEKQTNKTNQ